MDRIFNNLGAMFSTYQPLLYAAGQWGNMADPAALVVPPKRHGASTIY